MWTATQSLEGLQSTYGVIGQQTHLPVTVPSVGLILSPSVEPVPPKLLQRITSGQFLEMRELLPDNL